MKKMMLITTVVAGSMAITACAQKKNVPASVKNTFEQKFSNVKDVDWEQEGNEWEAEFKQGKTKYSATFDSNGKWMETEHQIDVKSVPTSITSMLKDKYGDYKIEEAEMSDTQDYGAVYELEVKAGKKEWTILVDKSGKIVKEEKEEKEDED